MGKVLLFRRFLWEKALQNPPVLPRVGMIRGQPPRPAQSPRGQPRPNQPGPTNPPQSPPITRANPSKPTRANQSGQPTPAKPGAKPPPKQSPNCCGPIAPQTGQTINPGQPPAKRKQPRKRAFEVSANQLSKAKKTPVLPGVVLGLRQLPKIINVKL